MQRFFHRPRAAAARSLSTSVPLPRTSAERLADSQSTTTTSSSLEKQPKTVLYLAYGSNLCAETFKGSRGIKPLSAVNIECPELQLTFDLPGIPYSEPCFANTGRRDASKSTTVEGHSKWPHGLIGVVYEVTKEDYAHIIATEGGGASYKDILVRCYPLEDRDWNRPQEGVDGDESTDASKSLKGGFLAHTLFAPYNDDEDDTHASGNDTTENRREGRFHRPSPDYAQPSPRYLKLITTGAAEHSLPDSYQAYLNSLQPYKITTVGQRLGQFFLLMTFGPFVFLLFMLMRMYSDEKGKSPSWLAWLSGAVFKGVWTAYDAIFKPVFGDGERTVAEKQRRSTLAWRSAGSGRQCNGAKDEEKQVLLDELAEL